MDKQSLSFFYFPKTANNSVLNIYKLAPKFISAIKNNNGNIEIKAKLEYYAFLCKLCKMHMNYNFNIDFTAEDYPDFFKRFQLSCFVRRSFFGFFVKKRYSEFAGSFINLKTHSSVKDVIPSFSDFFTSTSWAEREMYDLFGIYFNKNKDLRRLLTDYGFSGFPFRKDFPLTGYTEVRYNSALQRVIVEEIELSQEFRFFDFLNPWVVTS